MRDEKEEKKAGKVKHMYVYRCVSGSSERGKTQIWVVGLIHEKMNCIYIYIYIYIYMYVAETSVCQPMALATHVHVHGVCFVFGLPIHER